MEIVIWIDITILTRLDDLYVCTKMHALRHNQVSSLSEDACSEA